MILRITKTRPFLTDQGRLFTFDRPLTPKPFRRVVDLHLVCTEGLEYEKLCEADSRLLTLAMLLRKVPTLVPVIFIRSTSLGCILSQTNSWDEPEHTAKIIACLEEAYSAEVFQISSADSTKRVHP